MNGIKIYTIVVTYNAMRWAERCLGSLRTSSVPLIPVVIDNGSADGSAKYIQTHFPEATVFAQTKNLGFGQANNLGIRYALKQGATHVLLLNQDAWIDPDMIASLLRYDDGNSLLSPIHLTGDGRHRDANFEKNAIGRSPELQRFEQDQAVGRQDKYATREINAACWLLPAAVLQQTGGFSPLFFHYAEDNDYLQRLHFHGKGVYFVSGTYCYHDREHAAPKRPTAQSIYQQLVLRAVDINHSRFACWCHRLRYGLAVWHTALAEHRLRDIRYYYQAKGMFCKHYNEIQTNRQIIQTKGAHWLI